METLPDNALGDETATPSVEEPVASGTAAVDEGSGKPNEETVPKSRFDGLMGRFHQEQNRALALEAQIAALTAPAQEETEDVAGSEDVAALIRSIIREELAAPAARNSVLDRYPLVKEHFSDLLVGDSPEELESVAKVLNDRLTKLMPVEKPAAKPEAEAKAPEAKADAKPEKSEATEPEAPEGAGSVATNGSDPVEARVAQAVKSRSLPDLLAAVRDRALGSVSK